MRVSSIRNRWRTAEQRRDADLRRQIGGVEDEDEVLSFRSFECSWGFEHQKL